MSCRVTCTLGANLRRAMTLINKVLRWHDRFMAGAVCTAGKLPASSQAK